MNMKKVTQIFTIMKIISKLVVLTFLFVLIFTGCEKDDTTQPDKNVLRISKIADNYSMDFPRYTFEYNDDGLLTRIIYPESTEGLDNITEITYNENNQPIKCDDEDIIWNGNDFTIRRINQYENDALEVDKIYHLENGRVKDFTRKYYNPDGSISSSSTVEYTWIGNDSLYIEYVNAGFRFDDNNSPLKSIPLPILVATNIGLGEWEFLYQNQNCLIDWKELGDYGLSAHVTYTFNERIIQQV